MSDARIYHFYVREQNRHFEQIAKKLEEAYRENAKQGAVVTGFTRHRLGLDVQPSSKQQREFGHEMTNKKELSERDICHGVSVPTQR